MVRQRRLQFGGYGLALALLAAVAWAQDTQKAQPGPAEAPPAADAAATTRPASPAPETPPRPSPEQPPAPAAPAKDDGRTPPQVSAEDVLREFQKDRPKAQPLLPKAAEGAPAAPEGGAAAGGVRPRWPDGYMLVDRTGRLTREGPWWLISFVADNNPDNAPEPPLRVLPNQMLERMVRESEEGTKSVDFVVSGEVTYFMGENYLLVRKLLRWRDMGNLSK